MYAPSLVPQRLARDCLPSFWSLCETNACMLYYCTCRWRGRIARRDLERKKAGSRGGKKGKGKGGKKKKK